MGFGTHRRTRSRLRPFIGRPSTYISAGRPVDLHIRRWHSRQHRIPHTSRGRSAGAPAGSRQSPQGRGPNALLSPGIPADSRLVRNYQDRPVTPEVAGSSPVAPVKYLQNGISCCRLGRRRPPAVCIPRRSGTELPVLQRLFVPARRDFWLPSRADPARTSRCCVDAAEAYWVEAVTRAAASAPKPRTASEVLRRLQRGEPLPHAARGGEVTLAFVAVERLLERSGRLVAAAGGGENLGEIAKRVALQVQSVGPLRVLDCLACKSYSVGMSTALGENARLHLAPQCLRQQIFVVPKVAALLGQRLRLVIAAERAERATEHRRIRREVVETVQPLEPVAEDAQVASRSLMVAGDGGGLAKFPLAPVVAGQLEQAIT